MILHLACASAAWLPAAPQITPTELDKLTATVPTSSAHFGISASISGDTLVVGAERDDLVANNAGAAYVYVRDPGATTWGLVATLVGSDTNTDDRFGSSVGISGDTIVVGADWRQAAYVFERDQGGPEAWGEVVMLTHEGNGNNFAESVAIDGDTIAIGFESFHVGSILNAGGAAVYERDMGGPGSWGEADFLLRPSRSPGPDSETRSPSPAIRSSSGRSSRARAQSLPTGPPTSSNEVPAVATRKQHA